MYDYSDDDRKEVTERIDDPVYQEKTINLALGYGIYDILRMMLECLGEIEQILEKGGNDGLQK